MSERERVHAIHKQRGLAEHLFRCECGLRNMMRMEAVQHINSVAAASPVPEGERDENLVQNERGEWVAPLFGDESNDAQRMNRWYSDPPKTEGSKEQ